MKLLPTTITVRLPNVKRRKSKSNRIWEVRKVSSGDDPTVPFVIAADIFRDLVFNSYRH